MGKIFDFIFPPFNGGMALAADITEDGLLRKVPNPPNVQPASRITKPISINSAVDFARMRSITRKELLSIPAFRSAIMKVAGTAGSLPYHAMDANGQPVSHSLLAQPERERTRSVTMTRLATDLLVDKYVLWVVIDRNSDGFPTFCKHIVREKWDQDTTTGIFTVDGTKIDPADAKLFESPFEALTDVAAPTVWMIQKLRRRTANYADNPQAREVYKPNNGIEYTDEEIDAFLDQIQKSRDEGVAGWLPGGIDMETIEQMTPEQLMLVPAMQYLVVEVARLTGVDPTWLGVDTSTRTYSNIVDERRNFLDFVVMPGVILPMEERLSLDDMTPRGHVVKANLDVFLRLNTLERMQAYEIGSRVGAYDPKRVAQLEDLPRVIQPPTTQPPTTGGTQ